MKISFMRTAAAAVLGAAAGIGATGEGAAQQMAAVAGLEDVVVTATKRETNLQSTPIAISVIGDQMMEDRHADSLLALSDGAVPALRVATFEARQSALTVGMRGIVPFDQNQTARDTGVGVYVDGIYLGRSQGLNAALFDVQRIEVLRGPQGTLFGRNTEGGAVSIVTKEPTGDGTGTVQAGFGNYGAYDGAIHYNLPSYGNLALKFDGLVQHQDETTKNPMEGELGWGYVERVGGRVAAKWTPTDQFTANASFDLAKEESTPFFSQLLNYNVLGKTVRTIAQATSTTAPAGTINPLSPLVKVGRERQSVASIGTIQQASVADTGGLTFNLAYDVNDSLMLRSITGARAVAVSQWDNAGIESRNVFGQNATFGRYSLSEMSQRQISQEFQAVGNLGGSFEYVAGLYYFKERVKEEAATPFTNVWDATGLNYTIRQPYGVAPYQNTNNGGWQPGTRFKTRGSWGEAESFGAFAQGTYTPAQMDALHVTVGGRYTNDKREGKLYWLNGTPVNFTLDYDKSRFDPMVTLAYDVTDNANAYVKYSTGYRAGGANARSATFRNFGPEEVASYEVGLKTDLFDRLRANVAVYHMTRDDTQIDFDNVLLVAQNGFGAGTHIEETANAAGQSEMQGVELDLTASVTDNLTVGLSYAYTKVDIPAAPFPVGLSTNFLPAGAPFPSDVVYTPENAYTIFADYTQPLNGNLRMKAHLDANYADAQYSFQSEFIDTSLTATPNFQHISVKGDDSFIVNGSIALAGISMGDGREASVSLWSRNLLDETYVYRVSAANRASIGDYGNLNPPRTFGIELNVDF